MTPKCPQCGPQPDAGPTVPARACPACGTPYPRWDSGGFVARPPAAPDAGRPAALAVAPGPAIAAGAGLLDEPRAWCAGKNWLGRGLVLAWFIYLGVRHFMDRDFNSLFNGINLGIHELGHVLLSAAAFGNFIQFAAGTVFQLAAPIAGFVMFYRQRDWFGLSFAGVWLATNIYHIAWYMSSAHNPKSIPLLSPFGNANVRHDWNYLLSRFDLVQHDRALSTMVRWGGHLVIWASIIAATWLVWTMFAKRRESAGGSKKIG